MIYPIHLLLSIILSTPQFKEEVRKKECIIPEFKQYELQSCTSTDELPEWTESKGGDYSP